MHLRCYIIASLHLNTIAQYLNVANMIQQSSTLFV